MSLGGGLNPAINAAVKALTDKGVHVIVAAGNEAQDACNFSPASEKTAITVGATEDTSDKVTNFSNIGGCLDIFAPGQRLNLLVSLLMMLLKYSMVQVKPHLMLLELWP